MLHYVAPIFGFLGTTRGLLSVAYLHLLESPFEGEEREREGAGEQGMSGGVHTLPPLSDQPAITRLIKYINNLPDPRPFSSP